MSNMLSKRTSRSRRAGLGNYRGLGRRVFLFEPAMRLLLSEDGSPDQRGRFPYDREIALLLVLAWVLWPNDNNRQRSIARLVAGMITFHRRISDPHSKKQHIKTLDEICERFTEAWYKQLYSSFFVHVGGLQSLLKTVTPRTIDKFAEERRSEMTIPLDMLDFLLRARHRWPTRASRNTATEFVSRGGFGKDRYGIPIGEKRREKHKKNSIYVLGYDTVSKYWDNAPNTIGLAYVLKRVWPELWELKFADRELLQKLRVLADNREMIRSVLRKYHWLSDQCKNNFAKIPKLKTLPALSKPFSDESRPSEHEELSADVFSVDQVKIIEAILAKPAK